jgi:quinol---cytochrome c reductase iron-sulfur subunit, bacillus type
VADDGTTRGQFLSLSTVGIGAVIGGVIGVPVTAYILAPVTDEAEFEPVFLGKVDGFPADPSFKPTPATYVEDPQNPATSPGLAFVQNTGKTNTDWLAADAMFVVFSNRCMHLGCPVAVAQGVGFACPCHGGQYDKEGRRTAGPPIRPLDRFQWEIKNTDELWITQRWSVDFVNGNLTYFPVKMPGQPVAPPGPSIVADVLYPNVTYDHGPIPQTK